MSVLTFGNEIISNSKTLTTYDSEIKAFTEVGQTLKAGGNHSLKTKLKKDNDQGSLRNKYFLFLLTVVIPPLTVSFNHQLHIIQNHLVRQSQGGIV